MITKKESAAKYSSHHDEFFKTAIKNQKIFIDFIANYRQNFGLPDQEPKNLRFINSEYLVANKNGFAKIQADIVCAATIDGDQVIFHIEHQSTANKLLPLRMFNYYAAITKEQIEQGSEVVPYIFSICLYHNKKSKYPYNTNIFSNIGNKLKTYKCNSIFYFELTDLTVMNDASIDAFGCASIIAYLLRDSYLPAEIWLNKAAEHLCRPIYTAMSNEQFESFKLNAFWYIIVVYNGKKSVVEIIEYLSKTLPTEKKYMLSAADKLKLEGKLEGELVGIQKGKIEGELIGIQKGELLGIQKGKLEEKLGMAKKMLLAKVDFKTIKQVTELSDEELQKLID